MNGDVTCEVRQPVKAPKTTKLGMEIDSEEDEEDFPDGTRDEQKVVKNGSFSSSFLKSRNLFNLRLSTDSGTRLAFDTNSLPKKSPVTPYSRQTSSSDSQKSSNSPKPHINDLESVTPNSLPRQRRNSISSCYSISESSTANEMFSMNQSELGKFDEKLKFKLFVLCFRLSWTDCSRLAWSFHQLRRVTGYFILHNFTCTWPTANGFTRLVRSFLQGQHNHRGKYIATHALAEIKNRTQNE